MELNNKWCDFQAKYENIRFINPNMFIEDIHLMDYFRQSERFYRLLNGKYNTISFEKKKTAEEESNTL